MHDFLKDFKNLVKGEKVRTDNNVFKLHYRFSVIILIVFSILLSSKQYFGDPILCDADTNKEYFDVYCWVYSTFIVVDPIPDKYKQSNKLDGLGNEQGRESYSLLYYQWICLFFCIQALLFYIPRYLWKIWEGDRLGEMLRDLCGPFVPEKWTTSYKEHMRTYILNNENHDVFAYRFAFCEFLNLCNLVLQTILMNFYLEGKFLSYGFEVASKPWPMAFHAVFPKRAKCNFTKYGVSGSNESRDMLCILPLNILNEKFFLILWYWILFMFVVTVSALIYRFMFLGLQRFRMYLLMAQVRNLNRNKMQTLAKYLSHGQFFLLYNIGKNINPVIYKELLLSIYDYLHIKADISIDL
ncbi:innexin inx2-like [Euwallacea similis]|uniref:innexin inx2-like n=1 Tax=Euwallacea similis TaxID=1736056 RepID=UPI00344DDB57